MMKYVFDVEYRLENGKRQLGSFICQANNYEDIIYSYVLDPICFREIGDNYHFVYSHLFKVSYINESKATCMVKIEIDNSINRKSRGKNYVVYIECLSDGIEGDVLKKIYYEDEDETIQTESEPKTLYKLTKWITKEKVRVRNFLIQLSESDDFESFKERIPKSTFYRHYKYCKDKGYINNDKLVRKVWVKSYN